MHKPKQYPHTKKRGNMTFFPDIYPLGSSTKLGRQQLLMSPCTSHWAVTQETTYVQSLPLSYQMPRWQILAQWEKCSASRYLLHPSGNMSPQLNPLWEQHSLKIYSIAALTHMYIILVWYCNHHYSMWHKKFYWTGTRWQLAVKICNEKPVRSISE